MPDTLSYPDITGVRFDASSVELRLNGKRYIGVQEAEYEQTLDPGEVRGFSSQILGYTRGVQKASGRIVMLREEFQDMSIDLQTLAVGLLEANFLCTILYSERPPSSVPGNPQATSADSIWGMRFTGTRHRITQGSSDPITVEMPFVARLILVNGIQPMNNILRHAIATFAP